MPVLLTPIPGTNPSRWTPSGSVRHRADKVHLFILTPAPVENPTPTATPVITDHTLTVPPPTSTDTIRPAPTAASRQRLASPPSQHHELPPTDGTKSYAPSPLKLPQPAM
ncbi:hypothetical protein SprV_0702267800 [Sparganum proliferum]